jgi:hypothetical protein
MRVLVCGSRTWTDREIVYNRLGQLEPDGLTIITGGARGADQLAHDWATFYGVDHEVYPAEWDIHGRAAGPIRNQQMLDTGIDLVIAFRMPGQSRGTDHMVRIANAAGVATDHVTLTSHP